MSNQSIQLKRMPEPTWSWLKVNENTIVLPMISDGDAFKNIQNPDGIRITQGQQQMLPWEDAGTYFYPEEWNTSIPEAAWKGVSIEIPEAYENEEPVMIELSLDGNHNQLLEDIVIDAQPRSKARIVIRYDSKDEAEGYHLGRLRVRVQAGASLSIIKAQLLNAKTQHLDFFGGVVEEDAVLSVIQPEVGGSALTDSWNIRLQGERSSVNLDVLYLGEAEKRLDFSSRIQLEGKESQALVRAKGVLSGSSKKIFRDTLDFISGARGAKGREEEHVLMLSNKVRNISVPLLFCGEDDVEGEHAASSGKPDRETLLYLMSRGMSEKEARKLLAEASFSAVLDGIQEEVLKEDILLAVRKSIEQGGD